MVEYFLGLVLPSSSAVEFVHTAGARRTAHHRQSPRRTTAQPFEVRLSVPDMVDDRVLFLSVESPGTYELHRRLVQAVQPSAADIERYMEGDDIWHVHLTVGHRGQRVVCGGVGLDAISDGTESDGDLHS